MYVLAEKWGQRPDQILDGMSSAELSEAIAYYLLLQEEEIETAEQRADRQRIDRQLADARKEQRADRQRIDRQLADARKEREQTRAMEN